MNDLNIEALSEFLKSTDHSCMVEISDCVAWCMLDEDEVKWVEWNWDDHEHLEWYSAEIRDGITEHLNHYLMNLDNGCGGTYTTIFSKHNKLSVDDFYDKYEDCM